VHEQNFCLPVSITRNIWQRPLPFRPAAVVFIKGFLASSDIWSNAAQYFLQADYSANKLYAFD
jgi:pimeloyl-ACP methyl ester carboxylesterase